MTGTFWPQEKTDLLTRRWVNDGWTATQIVRDLYNAGYPTTRNAVIGKVHTLKLPKREYKAIDPEKAARIREQRRLRREAKANGTWVPRKRNNPARKSPPVFRQPATKRPAAPTILKPLIDLEPGECKWPTGHPDQDNFGFCGLRTFDGGPYCEAHHAIAYEPTKRRAA